jgi:hypothetical protein
MHCKQVYKCIVPCRQLAEFLNHKLKFRNAWVRAVVYTGLSFTLFTAGALQVVTAVTKNCYLHEAVTSLMLRFAVFFFR